MKELIQLYGKLVHFGPSVHPNHTELCFMGVSAWLAQGVGNVNSEGASGK